jgi:K(+)-stimulated pyrophosphate-energized sodium pump
LLKRSLWPALLLLLLSSAAFAAGGENVRLQFSGSDWGYIIVAGVFGLIALGVGGYLYKKVVAESTGNEKMVEVGAAIEDGAMAYLRQQIKTMSIFVVGLFVALALYYMGPFGLTVAIGTALCFVLGVGASYIAGYVGMKMAVKANVRTAAAALTSYNRPLEIAFRSGAVAGLITVGMGLVGAVLIFAIGQQDATKYLVGFGFGGSLAALFMRVGGGIFTKAADVGADLVGKVEAGIPEDDPRNPAVIADNVGDNVGDCAGMAADVFESYEVTLVAAIVLGAATAAIFDTATWTKLILFALMARGVGILASIVGIFMVKGSTDPESDPLKPISRGFSVSAITAGVLTVVLSFLMMGGVPAISPVIETNQLTSQDEVQSKETSALLAARTSKAAELKKEQADITAAELVEVQAIKDLKLTEQEVEFVLPTLDTVNPDQLAHPRKLKDFEKVDLEGDSPVLGYAVFNAAPATPPAAGETPETYTTLGERLKEANFTMAMLEVSGPNMEGGPRVIPFGPLAKEDLSSELERAKTSGFDVKTLSEHPMELYANAKGDVILAVQDPTNDVPINRLDAQQMGSISYFKQTIEELNEIDAKIQEETTALNARRTEISQQREELVKQKEAREAAGNDTAEVDAQIAELDQQFTTLTPETQSPRPVTPSLARVNHVQVQWWTFALCILFGIVMAFAFERLTDYYVALHKKPVQEVAKESNSGPALMIIRGFAYGLESAVFSVVAIVVCLIAPLLIFPPEYYGGYLLSFYGIALVGLGMLTTTGYILAMDTFGPISDNAQGIFEMSGAAEDNEEAAKVVQRLDAAGNTTKALTKGFAIATAVVAAVALFHAFVDEGRLENIGMRLEVPEIFLGLLLGGAAPYLFSAFSINAVGRAASELIREVRRQFRADAGIMAGTSKPDYGRCVAIVTRAAQNELLGPGILAIAFPLLVAFGFSIGKPLTIIDGNSYNLVGAQALGGFLAGTIISGQLMAVLLANSGGIWDNAKKLIEDGMYGGKGSDAHKAAVVCDTVGDPFKDTAGPALNPLIKVMNLVALLVVPGVIAPIPDWARIVITVVCLGSLVFAIMWSQRDVKPMDFDDETAAS